MNADLELAFEKLNGIVGRYDKQRMVAVVHAGEPGSKGVVDRKATTTLQTALADRFRNMNADRFCANVAIVALFFRASHHRIDADNMMKLVLDAGTNAGLWFDDCQVTAQASFVELDAEHPRTVLAFCDYTSTLNRGAVVLRCKHCTHEFHVLRSVVSGRDVLPIYCSKACAYAHRHAEVRCSCGVVFRRATFGQRFCSEACRRNWLPHRNPRPKCQGGCGRTVTRREYLLCRECWLKSITAQA